MDRVRLPSTHVLLCFFHFLVLLLLSFGLARRTCLIPTRRFTRSRMRACTFVCHTCGFTMGLKSIEWHYGVMLFQLIRFSIARQQLRTTNQQPNRTKDRQTNEQTHRERATMTTVTKWNDYDLLMFRILIKVQIRKTHTHTHTRTSKVVKKKKRSEHSICICTWFVFIEWSQTRCH